MAEFLLDDCPVVPLPSSTRAKKSRECSHNVKTSADGPFWYEESNTVLLNSQKVHRGITERERQQLKELVKSGFFSLEVLSKSVVQLNDESSDSPRLRIYDWSVTNYSKGKPFLSVVVKDGKSSIVDPNMSYEVELRRHHRLLFDPFRRGTPVFFESNNEVHRTTVGQLTFIKWCIENGVDKYVETNLLEIKKNMSAVSRHSRSVCKEAKKRRRELTPAPTRMVRGMLISSLDIQTDPA